MGVVLNGFIIQVVFFVLVVLVFGFLIATLNKIFYKIVNYNRFILYSTGFIGTPIHELSHLLMAVVFLHKIEKVSFFQISDDGVLGYVSHSYNPRNIWAQLGNFFIGIAPLISGAGLVYLVTSFLMPEAYEVIKTSVITFSSSFGTSIDLSLISQIFVLGKDFVLAILNNITSAWMFILYLVIMLSLSLHMNLSNLDIKGALKGLPFFLLVLAIVNVVFYLIKQYTMFSDFMINAGIYMVATMIISLIFSLVLVLIALIGRIIIKLIFRK